MRIALSFAALISAAPFGRADDTPAPTADQVAFYQKEVRPILEANCVRCHGKNPEKIRGGFNLTTRAGLLAGGDSGPGIDRSLPAASMLLKVVGYKNDDEALNMPPSGKLADAEIAVLTKWVNAGAAYDRSSADAAPAQAVKAKKADPNYWAFKPVVKPAVPAVKTPNWARTPVDKFVLAKLEPKGVTPNGPADKLALLRRATYDLTGLPPTVAEVDDYLADESDNAYERLIDRLLASPAYGEKWGRHWLDVVRYAESNGYERDGTKPFAWRYRDYVIDSYNADKPYTQFLREQLAGDELPNPTRESVIATGIYKLGVWDDEPADKEQALYDGYDDLVSVISQGVLGLSFNCARCHDHKGDFFPTEDYYKLVALVRDVGPYSGSRGGDGNLVDITPKHVRDTYEPELRKREAQLEQIAAQMRPIEDAAIKRMPPRDQLAVEDGHRNRIVRKVPQFLKGDETEQYAKLRARFKQLQFEPRPDQQFALAVKDAARTVDETNVLIRGSVQGKGKVVRAGFPEVFGVPDPVLPPDGKTSGRRTALADWVTSESNPMTARVMVNRVWQYHFGKGIVPTSNDFGKFGELPTHPELLDYLASEFVRGGWKLKPLHRLLMTSAVYRQSTASNESGLKVDPANTLKWRFDPRRLAAEEVRDTILMASGQLDRERGGPSVYPKIPRDVLAGQSQPGLNWLASKGGGYDPEHPEVGNRRSVYVHVKRSLQVPILATHDQADTDSSCPVRYTTTVPTQALGLLNGEFANEQAEALAARLTRDAPGGVEAQVSLAVRLATGREPMPGEVERDAKFITEMKAKFGLGERAALARYALLVLNSNEFLYLD